MPHDYTIRRATVEDSETLADLRIAFSIDIAKKFDPEQLPALRATLVAYFRTHIPTGQFLAWVAEAEHSIVGTSGLVFMYKPASFYLPTGVEAYIMNMYTVPAWRGCGIATALFAQLLGYIRTTDAASVMLHATQVGRPIYERFGFVGSDDVMQLSLR